MPPKPRKKSTKRKTLTRAQKERLDLYHQLLFHLQGITFSTAAKFLDDKTDHKGLVTQVKDLAKQFARVNGCAGQCYDKAQGCCVPCFGLLPEEGEMGPRAKPPQRVYP